MEEKLTDRNNGNTDKQAEQYARMVNTAIPKLIVELSIPTTLTMLVTNIYNMVDTAFVGMLGTSASGAVGIVFGFMMILQAIGFLFGQGGGSIMSRELGKGNLTRANHIASLTFVCAFTLSFIASAVCFIFLDEIVLLLGSTDTIKPYAQAYASYILMSAPCIVGSFALNNLLRYEGKASLGMIGIMTGAVLNIIGDPIFMFVLDMGIDGAGLSTCLSQTVSFIILINFFLKGKTTCRLSVGALTDSGDPKKDIPEIAATGLPSLLRQGLQSISVIVLNMLAGPYGDAAIAAMSIVSRVTFFVFSVALGIGQGFQPVSAYNYGARRYERIRTAFRFSFLLSQLCISVMSLAVIIFSGHVIAIFRDDPAVIEAGTRALVLQCATQLCSPFCSITEMLLQSTGRKLSASVLSSMKSGIIFIPTLLLMAKLRGFSGIQEAQPIANILMLIPAIIFNIHFFRYHMTPENPRPSEPR